MATETDEFDMERRSAAREEIHRPVVFAGVRGEGLLRQGMAMDISASGVLIHTMQPDLVGRHLELEIHPDGAAAPGDVVMVRGEIAWVNPLPRKGEHAMGVRFLQSVPATDVTGARYRAADKVESAALAESINRQLQSMAPAARLDISDEARRKSAVEPERPAGPAEKPRRGPRLLILLLLMILMAGLGLLAALGLLAFFERPGQAPPDTAPETSGGDDGTPAESPASAAPSPAAPSPAAPSPVAEIIEDRLESIRDQGPAYYVNRGSYLLAGHKYSGAARAFQAARRQPGVTPIERYIALLGEAEALAGSGDAPAALAILEQPFEGQELVPEPWRAYREHFRDMLLGAPESPEARTPLVNAFGIDRRPTAPGGDESGSGRGGPAAETAGDGAGLRIEIDTTRYLLTVLENNAIRAVYPVGLGARNETPEGYYSIVNKLEDPTWYNRGTVIPPGDPENQLGSRWLGLADGEGPTPLGIHATDEPESIGSNASRGCIRMRPKDVEALFEYVPVGTPVHIRAL